MSRQAAVTSPAATTVRQPEHDPRLRRALERAVELGETGIGVAAYHRGELFADLTAGLSDRERRTPVSGRTLFPIFSVTKGVTALALHMQADRGLVDPGAPIAEYWPEFGAHGKHTITVEQALSHRAGIPQMPAGVTADLLADWDWMVDRIAGYTPIFEPGTVNAYHVLVWGWIIGEIVRRTDPAGRSFDEFVYQEICAPLGVDEFHLGVRDDDLPRVATLYGGSSSSMTSAHNIVPAAVAPVSGPHNLRVLRQAVDPGAGAIATAGAVARIFALIAGRGELDGVRLLSAERADTLTRSRVGAHDPDRVLTRPVWFGAAGFWLGGEEGASDPLVGEHREIVYSPGAGGSLAWADLRDDIAVAICHNNMDAAAVVEPERTYAPIVRAIREIVAERQVAP